MITSVAQNVLEFSFQEPKQKDRFEKYFFVMNLVLLRKNH